MGLHPVVALIAIFVGAQLFGVLGLLGLPITLSFLKHMNDKGTIRVFKLGTNPFSSNISEISALAPFPKSING